MFPSYSPTLGCKWDNKLAFDLALRLEGSGEEIDAILKRHNTDALQMAAISEDPVFQKQLEVYRTEIRTNGITFKMKARSQAEELLYTSWSLIHSEEVSPAVKADLIKSTVRWAGLDSKDNVGETGGGSVKITINLGDTSVETKLVEAEPIEVED